MRLRQGLTLASRAARWRPPSAGGISDPYFTNVVALLPLDGAAGSTIITDVTGKSWTAFGNAAMSSTTAPYGTTAAAFDGVGDYLELNTATADVAFGTGDFTIECYAYVSDSTTEYQTIIQPNTSYLTALDARGSTGTFRFYENGIKASSAGGPTSTWRHVAYARQGGTGRLFVAGVKSATDHADAVNYSLSGKIRIGAPTSALSSLTGRIKGVRITKGVARYTANFTPPTTAFPSA